MIEVQALPVAEVDYKWPDDELVVRLSDYDALAAECERLREQHEGAESQAEYQRDRAEHFQAERDAALAELAALKGGQEPAAWAVCREPGKVDALSAAYASESAAKAHVNSYASNGYSGLHVTPLYTAPPAQTSAWVAEGWKLVPVEPTPAMLRAGVEIGVGVMPIFAAMLAAAPTPGASDGKGGEK